MIYFKLFWCNLCFILWGKKSSVTELVTARLPMTYFEKKKKKKKRKEKKRNRCMNYLLQTC